MRDWELRSQIGDLEEFLISFGSTPTKFRGDSNVTCLEVPTPTIPDPIQSDVFGDVFSHLIADEVPAFAFYEGTAK